MELPPAPTPAVLLAAGLGVLLAAAALWVFGPAASLGAGIGSVSALAVAAVGHVRAAA